ncbi:MAG TPA: ATP-binding protein, partial [Candidatus Acidoferrales bacterium]|nr:ATP-binding protein [Candidatus Acidoferrales bacterium]
LTLAAHELGTPLHVVSNCLDLLSDGGVLPAALPWLQTARRNAAWLGRGLAQMMTAGRWQQKPLKLQRRDLDLRLLLASLCARFEHASLASGRCLKFTANLGATPTIVDVDALWLERAAANLLSNAIRFTADGGAISVSCCREANQVAIAVEDTGVGIDRVQIDQVFEPFSTAAGDVLLHGSGELSFGARGLGLGLAIARAVAEQHGGTLTVRSQPNHGSCFTLKLPLSNTGLRRSADR